MYSSIKVKIIFQNSQYNKCVKSFLEILKSYNILPQSFCLLGVCIEFTSYIYIYLRDN